MRSPEQQTRDTALAILPVVSVLYFLLGVVFTFVPIGTPASLMVISFVSAGCTLALIYVLLRRGIIGGNLAASLGSLVAVGIALSFVAIGGHPRQTVALVIVLISLGSFLLRKELAVACAAVGVAGWAILAWRLNFASDAMGVWGPAVVVSALLGIALTSTRQRLAMGITTQIAEGEQQRDRAEAAAKQLKARTAELEFARDRALASVEAKQRFLAHMSHEIRTPLNGILGLLELISRTKLDPTQRERVGQVRRSGDALLAIVNDLLDLSRIEAGALTMESIAFDVGRVVEEVTSNHAAAAHAKGLELLVELDPVLPARVFGDPLRLRQVLTNLLGNAIKFTRMGEVFVRCRVVGLEEEDAHLEFSVTDSGVGMSAEELARVFAPFAQADESTTREFGGTGLGLTISRQLVELMGGELVVESVKDEGSTFHFPVIFQLADELSGSGVQLSAALVEARVLVVDANPRVQGSLRGHIESWGVFVSAVESVDAIDATMREGEYTVVLVDLRTLGDDWAEVTASLASSTVYGKPRVVAMSAGLIDPSEDHRRDGIYAALSKPVMRRQLLTTIAQAHQAKPVRPGRATSQTVDRARRPTGIQDAVASGIRVLVAEDQPTNRVVVQGFLEELGYEAVLVTNGAEAVAAIHDHAFALVLMDCQMPTMDGYTATEKIRVFEQESGRARVPIVALTAHAFPAERVKTQEAGMDEHLAKPLSIDALGEVLLRFCPAGPTLDADVIGELAALGGDRFITRLRTSFEASVEERMVAILGAAKRSELDEIRRGAHALKGAARQLGAARLGDLFADIEDHPSQFERRRLVIEAEVGRVMHALEALAAKAQAK